MPALAQREYCPAPVDVDQRRGSNVMRVPIAGATTSGSSQRYPRLNITGNTVWPAGQVSEFEAYAS
jgi:hypothetical protein